MRFMETKGVLDGRGFGSCDPEPGYIGMEAC